jgi:hypothetical protein
VLLTWASQQEATELTLAIENALSGGNGVLEGLWYDEGPNTLHAAGVISTWISTDTDAKTASLYSSIFAGADPRPLVGDPRGIYFNSQAGLTVSSGILPNVDNFGIVFAHDMAIDRVTTYATKAAADAAVAGKVEGDVALVTSDTTTTYTPDFDKVFEGGYADANLVNGYYHKSGAVFTGPSIYELFAFKGAGTEYLKGYINRLGQLEVSIYAGAGAPYSVRTNCTVSMEAGAQICGVYKTATRLYLWWQGQEMEAVDVTALAGITFTTFYFNGDTRVASTATPCNGFRHYVKAFAVIDDCTWAGFRDAHNAVARYAGTPALDVPAVAWGLIKMGQSWAQGSTTVTDAWRPTSGWDGEIDRVNTSNSGEKIALTREYLPRVRCTRGMDNNSDIGPLRVSTNSLGTVEAANSYKSGEAETTDWGLFKHLLEHPDAPDVDWTIGSVYAGGNTIANLSAETPVAIANLRATASSGLTSYEELLQSVCFAYDFHTARGQTYVCKVFFWQQGHSDTGNTNYQTDLYALYDKLNTAVKTITGQAEDLICIFPQVNYSSVGHNNRGNTGACIDQIFLNAVTNRGARPMYCFGPMYQITNYIHCYRAGYRWIGELAGKALKRILFDAEDFKPLQPTTFTRGATWVDIDFNPVGSLEFADTNENNIDARDTFDGVDTYGFEFHSGTPATFTVTIASPGVVTQTAHGKANGDKVSFDTTGALPTGLAVNTVYFVINQAANTYQLSLTSGGAAINTSGTQSGTHTSYNVSKKITAVAITDSNTVRVTLDTAPVAGDTIKYTGRASRFGNLVDQDTETAYYRDQDWDEALVSGSPVFAEGELNDLRNWCCAFTQVLT